MGADPERHFCEADFHERAVRRYSAGQGHRRISSTGHRVRYQGLGRVAGLNKQPDPVGRDFAGDTAAGLDQPSDCPIRFRGDGGVRLVGLCHHGDIVSDVRRQAERFGEYLDRSVSPLSCPQPKTARVDGRQFGYR